MAAHTRLPDLVGLGKRRFRLAFGSLAAVEVDCFRVEGNREVPYDVAVAVVAVVAAVAAPAAAHGPGSVVAGV